LTEKHFIYLAFIVIAIIIGIKIRAALSQSRSISIRAIAEELGFSFKPDDCNVLNFLKAFPLYTRGYDRKVKNIIVKNMDDIEIMVFDYAYTTGPSPKNQSLRIQTVVLFKPKTYELPEIKIHSGENNPRIRKEAFDYLNELLSMCVESNKHGIILYEDQIQHPAEDIRIIILQRLKLFELITAKKINLELKKKK
jgi:hypothetical protein